MKSTTYTAGTQRLTTVVRNTVNVTTGIFKIPTRFSRFLALYQTLQTNVHRRKVLGATLFTLQYLHKQQLHCVTGTPYTLWCVRDCSMPITRQSTRQDTATASTQRAPTITTTRQNTKKAVLARCYSSSAAIILLKPKLTRNHLSGRIKIQHDLRENNCTTPYSPV